MKLEIQSDWAGEEYGFFGPFYHMGDHSDQGYDITQKMDFELRTNKEIEAFLTIMQPDIGTSVLDCPCGSGRHSIKLAKLGYKVTGVDVNKMMLSFRNDFGNDALLENLTFIQMDMRSLNLPDNTFNYLINMFISFGFFSDEENFLVAKEFYRVLKKGGYLYLHLDLNYDNVINGKFQEMEHISRTCYYGGKHRTLNVKENYNQRTKRLEGSWTIVNGDRVEKSYSLRIYENESEFIPLFKNAGFSEVKLIDPRTKNLVTRDSIETVLIAKK